MIRLPLEIGYSLRASIDEYRKKYNIVEPDELKTVYNKQESFLEEELKYVTSMNVTKASMKYLDYFPNVIAIKVTGEKSLTQEELNSLIRYYPALRRLKIDYDKPMVSGHVLTGRKFF